MSTNSTPIHLEYILIVFEYVCSVGKSMQTNKHDCTIFPDQTISDISGSTRPQASVERSEAQAPNVETSCRNWCLPCCQNLGNIKTFIPPSINSINIHWDFSEIFPPNTGGEGLVTIPNGGCPLRRALWNGQFRQMMVPLMPLMVCLKNCGSKKHCHIFKLRPGYQDVFDSFLVKSHQPQVNNSRTYLFVIWFDVFNTPTIVWCLV